MMEGPGADSEEKHEPVSDIDPAVMVVGLKALDPEWPIREALALPVIPRLLGFREGADLSGAMEDLGCRLFRQPHLIKFTALLELFDNPHTDAAKGVGSLLAREEQTLWLVSPGGFVRRRRRECGACFGIRRHSTTILTCGSCSTSR